MILETTNRAGVDRVTAPFTDWQDRSLARAEAAYRRMMEPQSLARGRHQFTDASGVERENGL